MEWVEVHGKVTVNANAIVDRVQRYARQTLGLSQQDPILVAVSGGPDSVALLHILLELGYSVGVAHFDHRTRAGESAEDAAFVRDLARSLDVPLYESEADVAAEAAQQPESFEMHARRLRYAFLTQTARDHAYACIATGHHADDQAETVLMRVIRGTSPQGLAGVPPVRVDQGIRIVRPMLACRRQEILAFLSHREIAYRTDVSNIDQGFVRNRVRNSLIPLLHDQFNPRVQDALIRLADIQRSEQEFLDHAAREAAEKAVVGGAIHRQLFAALPVALQRRVLQHFAWRLGVDCGHERLSAVADAVAQGRTGALLELGGGIRLRTGATVAEVETSDVEDESPVVPLAVPGVTLAFMRRFTARYLDQRPRMPLQEYCTPTRQIFDADAVAGRLCVRRRRTGDRFTPLGMQGTRKLKDYLIDLKLTPSERAGQLLLVSGETIVWVVGRAVSAQVAVNESSRQVLEVEVAHAD